MTPDEQVELRAYATRLEDYLRAARQRVAELEAEVGGYKLALKSAQHGYEVAMAENAQLRAEVESPRKERGMTDLIVRINQTQCCDPVIDSLLGAAKEQISALQAKLEAEKQRAATAFSAMVRLSHEWALATAVSLAAERDRLRAALKVVEWGGPVLPPDMPLWNGRCPNPECRGWQRSGHAPDCIVGMALEVK